MFREFKYRNIFVILIFYVLYRWVFSVGGCYCVDGFFLFYYVGDFFDFISAGLYLRGYG